MRRDAREAVYKILFAEIFNDGADDAFLKETYAEQKLSKEDAAFADELLSKIRENRSEIDAVISDKAKGYTIERIYSTDRCALTIAICEILFFNDIPSIVSIDEALSLVRKYSTEESLNFVNGILATVKKEYDK